jgi:3-oxoacyl-[acyl-carrier-protein] synthase-3
MPMTISWLGNSSVATLPTLYDLMQSGKIDTVPVVSGDYIMFASVGAGMSINAVVYKV